MRNGRMKKGVFTALSIIAMFIVVAACDDGSQSWSRPALIGQGNGDSIKTGSQAYYFAIGMDAGGQAVVVWEEDVGEYHLSEGTYTHLYDKIRANRFNGSAWGTPVQFVQAPKTNHPQVAMAPDGRAMAVWSEWSSDGYLIQGKYFDGSAWKETQLIENTGANPTRYCRLGMDGRGRAILVWQQEVGFTDKTDMWAKRFDGTVWHAAEMISDGSGGVSAARIRMDTSGRAIAIWSQGGSTGVDIWARCFDGSAWGTAEVISDGPGNLVGEISMDADGNAIVVWSQMIESVYKLWARRFNGSAWQAAEMISDGLGGQVAMDAHGHAIVVWQQWLSSSTAGNLLAKHFDGSTWGPAEALSDSPSYSYRIAMDADGHGILAWIQRQADGTSDRAWARHFDGAAWDAAQIISDNTNKHYEELQMAMNAQGHAMVVYLQTAPGNRFAYKLWATRFKDR